MLLIRYLIVIFRGYSHHVYSITIKYILNQGARTQERNMLTPKDDRRLVVATCLTLIDTFAIIRPQTWHNQQLWAVAYNSRAVTSLLVG